MTESDKRRTIDELATLYELEPDIRDVFVEGTDDRAVLEWYLGERTKRFVSVAEIDSVHVPDDTVLGHGHKIGNRGRVISLAYELESRLDSNAQAAVTLVVDADFDHIKQVSLRCSMLLSTDFSCFEMYWFNDRVIEKCRLLAGVPRRPPVHTFLDELAKVLQCLFVIRLSNETLELRMSWIPFNKVCSKEGDAIAFDKDEFVRRYLMKNGQTARLEDFREEIATNRTLLRGDPRYQINGHDFTALFYWYIHPLVSGKKGFMGEESVKKVLRTCVELDQLDDQPMFQRILARVTAA